MSTLAANKLPTTGSEDKGKRPWGHMWALAVCPSN